MYKHISASRPFLAAGLVLIALLLLSGLVRPLDAQGSFATNTPAASSDTSSQPQAPSFATNTPVGFEPAPVTTPVPLLPAGPDAPLVNYALRLWLESDMLDLISDLVDDLHHSDDDDVRLALRMSQYELQARFPGAPRSPDQRERLMQSMLMAPAGSVDMRRVVRPYIESTINASGHTEGVLQINGFTITMTTANLDGRGRGDAVVGIRYTAEDGTILYDDYVLAVRSDDGALRFVPTEYALPAAPFNGVRSITLVRVDDVNRDGLDEAVLLVDDGAVNRRMYILTIRSGSVIDLTLPSEEIRVGQVISWPVSDPANPSPVLRVAHYRAESELPDWPCLSERPVEWSYQSNFYRPGIPPNSAYTFQDSLGCTLLAAEPLFALDPVEAIDVIETALERYSMTAPGAERALMTIAMMYTLGGQIDRALTTAQSIQPAGDGESWVARQSAALIEALGIASNTGLDVCAALLEASESGACDIDTLMARYFGLLTLRTEDDLVTQLETMGFPVLEAMTVSEVGRADRTVVRFDLAGSNWWAFAPGRDGIYTISIADPPAGTAPVNPPRTVLEAPQTVYDQLFINRDPAGALNILDSIERNNPGIPLAPSALYLRALSHDLLSNRTAARTAYFDLWTTHPGTVWGRLASQHLERR